MYCRSCGSSVEDGQFCPDCGRPLDELPETRTAQRGSGALANTSATPPSSALSARAGSGALQTSSSPVGVADETHVTVNVAGPQIVYQDKMGHGLLVRALWFVFFGWWLGQIWLSLAWLLNLTLIGLPLGLMMINTLPKVMTLRQKSAELQLTMSGDGSYALTRQHIAQRPFWQRAVFFLLVGWWLSLIWAEIAYLCCIVLILLPVGFLMFDRMPAVTTLARY